jgi:hypothetical protein
MRRLVAGLALLAVSHAAAAAARAHRSRDGGCGLFRVARLLTGCDIRLERDRAVRDMNAGLTMSGRTSRMCILGRCVENRPCLINALAEMRARSNADLGRFLAVAFAPP